MNRQQRRQVQRESEAMRRLMNSAQQKRREQLADQIEVELYFTAFGLAINEVYGWGEIPIMKLWKATDNWISKVASGELTFEQMKEELNKRANIICSFN